MQLQMLRSAELYKISFDISELVRICGDTVVAYFKLPSLHPSGWTEWSYQYLIRMIPLSAKVRKEKIWIIKHILLVSIPAAYRSPSGPVCAPSLYLLSHIMTTEMIESLKSVGMIRNYSSSSSSCSSSSSIFISVAPIWSIGHQWNAVLLQFLYLDIC
jgi:hypothetical protein